MTKPYYSLLELHKYIKKQDSDKSGQREFAHFLTDILFADYPHPRKTRIDFNPDANVRKYLIGSLRIVDEDSLVSDLSNLNTQIEIIKRISFTIKKNINDVRRDFKFLNKTELLVQLNKMIDSVTFTYNPIHNSRYYDNHKDQIDKIKDTRHEQYKEYFRGELNDAKNNEERLYIALSWMIILGSVGMKVYEIGDFWNHANDFESTEPNISRNNEHMTNEQTEEAIREELLPQINVGVKKQIECKEFAEWALLDGNNPYKAFVISGDIGAGKSNTLNYIYCLSKKWSNSLTKMRNCRNLYSCHAYYMNAKNYTEPERIDENVLIIVAGLEKVSINKEREILKSIQHCQEKGTVKAILSTTYVDNDISAMVLMNNNAIEAKLCSIDIRKISQLKDVFWGETSDTISKSTPFEASLYLKLYESGKPIKAVASRHELMAVYFDRLFIHEDLQEYIVVCSALAWERKSNIKFSMDDDFFTESPRTGVSWADIKKKYTNIIDFVFAPKPVELYKTFIRRGIFCRREGEVVFSHEAFSEYLAALFVCEMLKANKDHDEKNTLIIEEIISDIVMCKNVDEVYRSKLSFAESVFFTVMNSIERGDFTIDLNTMLKLGITIGNYDHHGAGLFVQLKPLIEKYFAQIDSTVDINVISAICGYLYEITLHFKELDACVSYKDAFCFVKEYQEKCASLLLENNIELHVDANYKFGLMKSFNNNEDIEHIRKTILSQIYGNWGAALRRHANYDTENAKKFLKDAIEKHRKGLEYKIETGKWMQSGHLSIASDYVELSKIENEEENLKKAIKEYERALDVLGLGINKTMSDEMFKLFDYRTKIEIVSTYLNIIRYTKQLFSKMNQTETSIAVEYMVDCFAEAVNYCIKCFDNHVAKELLKDLITKFDKEIRCIFSDILHGNLATNNCNDGCMNKLHDSGVCFNAEIASIYGMKPYLLK